MRLSIMCKTGKIQLTDDDILRVRGPLGTIWQVPAASVTGFTIQQGMMASAVTIHSMQGNYRAETVANRNLAKLQAAFPHLQSAQQAGREWYHNPAALTHVATYTSQKQMQTEMEAAYQNGWMIQGQSGTGGVVDIAGFWIRGRDRTTITYVRTPQWLADQQK